MSLAAGMRVGHYEILAAIGAGGMGEVWRARDTKLGRDVALKILPAAFSNDPDRLARFQREARVLASLDHPNIGPIYGLEDGDGVRALVLALIEGPTLADRIAAGPLGEEDAVHVALQIAEAFEYAHDRGVIHRDLKPANIKITLDGAVKVLDFGLAKALEAEDASTQAGTHSPTMLPTVTLGATQAGMIVGTAAYISPEQVKGRRADRRSDIWAFGVVLFEMLTGGRPFDAESVGEMLANIVKEEPKLGAIPTRFRPLVARCLVKDPRKRLQSFGEARLMLESPADIDLSAPNRDRQRAGLPASLPAPSQSRFRAAGWIAAGVLAVAAAAGWFGYYRATRPAPLKPPVRLDVDLGPDVSLSSPRGEDVILSHDGTRIAYVSKAKLFTRRLDEPNALELVGTEGAFAPFFSPDDQFIAFFTATDLKKISISGGLPVNLATVAIGNGGSWGDDGNIVAALGARESLSGLPSAGGKPFPLLSLNAGETTQRWPQILPRGKAVLFTSNAAGNGFAAANVDAISLLDKKRKRLVQGATFGRYLAASPGTGYLIYLNAATLYAAPFDAERLELRGTPVPILQAVRQNNVFGSGQFSVSQTGTLIYRSGAGGAEETTTVQWLDAGGKTQALLSKPGAYQRPRISPDGRRLALEVVEGANRDVWIYEIGRDTMTRLTFGAGTGVVALGPIWTPDGRFIAFAGRDGMYWTRADGAGRTQRLTASKNQQVPVSFTPDGRHLAWNELVPNNGYDCWTVPIEVDDSGLRAGEPEPFLTTPFDERIPVFSPDGRWLSYTSNESGSYEVYVRAFPDKGGKWQISNSGGSYSAWSHDGRHMFFRNPANQIMVVDYAVKGDSFVPDKPRLWSEKRLADFGIVGVWTYDVAPDDKRIVGLMPVETPEAQQAQNHVIFLENFVDELKRKVPLK